MWGISRKISQWKRRHNNLNVTVPYIRAAGYMTNDRKEKHKVTITAGNLNIAFSRMVKIGERDIQH